MKKMMILILGALATSSVLAMPPDMGAPITGSTERGSWVDVRVTANVVEGIAVNEASPIDFGNLLKDTNAAGSGSVGNINNIYKDGEQVHEHTPGRVVYRAPAGGEFITRLETNRIDLKFQRNSGKTDETSTNTTIYDVRIEGIKDGNGETIDLINGQADRRLTAWFQAYHSLPASQRASYTADYENGNLGKQQRLGYYEGTVRVYAETASTM